MGGGKESDRGAKKEKVSCSRQRSWVRSRPGSWSPNISLVFLIYAPLSFAQDQVSCPRPRSWVVWYSILGEKRSRPGSCSPKIFLQIPNLHNISKTRESAQFLFKYYFFSKSYVPEPPAFNVVKSRPGFFCKSSRTSQNPGRPRSWVALILSCAKKEVERIFIKSWAKK